MSDSVPIEKQFSTVAQPVGEVFRMGTAGAVQCGVNSSEIRRELIQAQLARILSSPGFRRADGLSRMLRFIVDRTIDGDRSQLKEYCVAVGVFGREVDFDPKDFALVRVQATRLRRKLEQFYRAAGSSDPVVITVPKGGYVAHFEQRAIHSPTAFFLEHSGANQANLLPDRLDEGACYARGLHLLRNWDERSLIRCAALCRQAIRSGADFPSIRGLLALSLGGLYWFDCLPPDEIAPMAREAAAEALRADSENVHARLVLAYLGWSYDRDPRAARHHMNAVSYIAPRRAEVVLMRVFRFACLGRAEDADAELAFLESSEKWSAEPEMIAALAAAAKGDYPTALAHLHVASALEEHSPFVHWCTGMAHLCAGAPGAAALSFERAVVLDGAEGVAAASLAYSYGCAGRKKEATGILNDLLKRSVRQYVSKIELAKIHVGLGDLREAMRCLDIANRERSGRLPMALFMPEFEPLRKGRKFWRILEDALRTISPERFAA